MINFNFDLNNRYEKPSIIVCNPNLEQLEYVSYLNELTTTLRFNAISEITFKTFEKCTDDKTGDIINLPCYEHLVKNKILYIVDVGYFVIYNTEENMEGWINTKTVTAYSYEYTLNKKYANLSDGVYNFYDPITPNDTLLGKIIQVNPSWKIGHIDSDLFGIYRSFSDIDGKDTIYKFLMTSVEEAYGCIFDFDINNLTINAYTANNAVSESDIVLSFDSVIKNIKIADDDKSIISALRVAGSGDLTINNVNPLGTDFIYNFDYYKTTKWMLQELIDVINEWESRVESNRSTYSIELTNLKNKNAELITLQGQLVDLQGELAALDELRTAQYPNVLQSTTTSYNNKEVEIQSKISQISNKQLEISQITNTLSSINSECRLENNFTPSQLNELEKYIYEDSYINDNYEVTNSMNYVEIMELTEQLYQAGQRELSLISQPNYTFSMDAVNFLFSKEYQSFIDQIKMGCKIYVQTANGDVWFSPLLLEMVINYDNPENFSMTFGNRFRISDNVWTIRELMGDVKSTNSSVKGNASSWTQGGEAGKEFIEYKNSNLVAANQLITNSEKQSVLIGNFGIRSRKLLDGGTYSPEQLWINNGLICMTDNNWETTKLAIGNINGTYSVNAEVIAGNLIAGGNLKIYTENGSFTVDGSGAKLVNADLTMTSENGRAKMYLSPTNGIRIQTSSNGTSWEDKFYVDTTNNKLIFKGDLISDSGTIGGWIINKDGLTSPYGDYLKSTGYGKIGLLTYTPTSATFNGYIFGRNLDSKGVTTSKIDDEAVTPAKLDRVYATYGQFQSLVADVAQIEDLVATKASISQLNAVSARVSSLQASMITTDELFTTLAGAQSVTIGGRLYVVGSFYLNETRIRFKDVEIDGKKIYYLSWTP